MRFILDIAWIITGMVLWYIAKEQTYIIGQRARYGQLVAAIIFVNTLVSIARQIQ